jgi:hypothetical protein
MASIETRCALDKSAPAWPVTTSRYCKIKQSHSRAGRHATCTSAASLGPSATIARLPVASYAVQQCDCSPPGPWQPAGGWRHTHHNRSNCINRRCIATSLLLHEVCSLHNHVTQPCREHLHLTVTVAVAVPPLPSDTVYWKLSV